MVKALLSELDSEIDIHILACPYCVKRGGGQLHREGSDLQCADCGRKFPVQAGTIIFMKTESLANEKA